MRAINDLTVTDLSDAVEFATDHPRRLLPEREWVTAAIEAHRDEFAQMAHTQITGEWQPSRERIIGASKARHGVRPVAVWDPVSHAAYDALVARITPSLPQLVRSGDAWREFLRSPLEDYAASAAKYIVAADIASCYQFIDHGTLAAELTERSNDRAAVQSIVDLLRETGDRRYGLPQQSRSSDVIAEPYLARLERALVRKGLILSRYNDDFRIVCASWSEVNRAIEVLSDEARQLGLTLNDSKIITSKRATYEKSLDEGDKLREEISGEVGFVFDEYDEDNEAREDEADTDVALTILERWQKIAGTGEVAEADQATHRSLLDLLPRALGALRAKAHDDPFAVEVAFSLLRFEQTLTPNACRYLAAVPTEGNVVSAFDTFLQGDRYLTDWQAWWLQIPLRRVALADGTGGPARLAWLEKVYRSTEQAPLIRAETALTMAAFGHAETAEEELVRRYDRATRVERPTFVAALATVGASTAMKNAVIGDSLLHEWIFDAVESHA
jgi:RNA-directed DNA polymerase